MSDLAVRLKAVIEERLRVARAAVEEFQYFIPEGPTVTPFITANDPPDALVAGEWALGVLERHEPEEHHYGIPPEIEDAVECSCGYRDWPCDEILAMAKRYGVTE